MGSGSTHDVIPNPSGRAGRVWRTQGDRQRAATTGGRNSAQQIASLRTPVGSTTYRYVAALAYSCIVFRLSRLRTGTAVLLLLASM